MEKLTAAKLIEALKAMTVLELTEVVKALETEFGVSQLNFGSAPSAESSEGSSKAAEKSEFDVVITGLDASANKVGIIKIVKEVTGLSLKEAKDIVDGAPKTVKAAVAKDEAESIEKQLKDAGATVELK